MRVFLSLSYGISGLLPFFNFIFIRGWVVCSFVALGTGSFLSFLILYLPNCVFLVNSADRAGWGLYILFLSFEHIIFPSSLPYLSPPL